MNFSLEQVMGWLVANQNIPTSEIERDIADTEREIADMTREAEAFAMLGDKMSDFRRRARLDGIKERETFIAKLKAILEARKLVGGTPAATPRRPALHKGGIVGITINAENLDDARDKLRLREQHWPIKLRFRNSDYGREALPGCIVDAVGAPDQDVPRQFTTSSDALRYIASLLKKRDEYVRKEAKARKAKPAKKVPA